MKRIEPNEPNEPNEAPDAHGFRDTVIALLVAFALLLLGFVWSCVRGDEPPLPPGIVPATTVTAEPKGSNR